MTDSSVPSTITTIGTEQRCRLHEAVKGTPRTRAVLDLLEDGLRLAEIRQHLTWDDLASNNSPSLETAH